MIGQMIAKTGKIPNKSANDMSLKWRVSDKLTKSCNPLEKAFKDSNAKVAKNTEVGTIVGTVTGYDMDTETREGTWIITWQDGTTNVVKKEGLIAALNVYDDTTADEQAQQMIVAVATDFVPSTRKPRPELNHWTGEELMTLYRLQHAIGSNDWAKIEASGKIPNKMAKQMALKWTTCRTTQDL